jgi:phenol 2-monooxygenase
VITGKNDHQSLATGLPMGERFHSAPVVRLADAKPMELGHAIEVGHRWTLFAFAPEVAAGDTTSTMWSVLDKLQNDPESPIKRSIDAGHDPDNLLDLRAIYQQGFRDIDWDHCTPPYVQPRANMA